MMKYAVWALRILVGAVFVFSGFAKAVDPWGFVYKIGEYLSVWGLDWIPREIQLCAAGIIATFEFTAGVLTMLGCCRRLCSLALIAMMALMLPLTAYIAISSPVDDCGCFGDAWVLSNTATFIKNVVLTALIIVLVRYNLRVQGIYRPSSQWEVLTVSILYCFSLVAIGWLVQPMVDFRPYKVGHELISTHADDEDDEMVLYEKDGVQQAFSVDDLPDSSWTYVGRVEANGNADGRLLAIFEGDEDVTDLVVSQEGPQMLLLVSNPKAHTRARASMANRISEYMESHEGNLICLIPLAGDQLDQWKDMVHPNYEIYTAEDTSIEELARGDAALVYLQDGVIKWKRNLYSMPGDFPDFNSHDYVMDNVWVVDDGNSILTLTIVYIFLLFLPMLVEIYKHRP